MAYTTNPNLPKVRGQAVEMVRQGNSVREVARHFGFSHSAIVKWVAKAKDGCGPVLTKSSRPKRSPSALSREIVGAIIGERNAKKRCAEHVYHALKKQGVVVSLSSVKRTFDRCHLTKKRSPWKRPHDPTPRPEALYAGALLQCDTVHIIAPDGSRIYVYTIIDLYSRFAYAEVVQKIGAQASVEFVRRAQRNAPFRFEMVQTDNGSEFSTWCTHGWLRMGIRHRHGRVRKSNDQAHVERFNRTIQEECLDSTVHTISGFRKALKTYLPYYNNERTHMGINYLTPLQMVPRS
jgi:transposase InsO family protein